MPERRFVYTPAMVALTALALLIPLAGLVLLLNSPQLNVHWEHHPAHFWLVLLAAGLSAGLAYVTITHTFFQECRTETAAPCRVRRVPRFLP